MKRLSLFKLIGSMTCFGTIGMFVRYIDAGRGFIAFVRGIVGALFLILLMLVMKRRPSWEAIKKNLLLLLFSGIAIGINWVLLFESYSYTTIATSTLCYYMAPVFVMLASPFVLGERITAKKGISIGVALVGMVLVSGVLDGTSGGAGHLTGVLLALGAALFYASVTMMNKKLRGISSYDMTVVQLLVASLAVMPYTFFVEENNFAAITPTAVIMLLVVGILHTGISYALFFSSIQELSTQTVAIFSYLDPIVALFISMFIDSPMTLPAACGAVLILAALIYCEIDFGSKTKAE